MLDNLKAFVDSDYCLKCRGCCVFREPGAEKVWAPRASVAELQVIAAKTNQQISEFSVSRRIATVPEENCSRCVFLDPADHKCRIYGERPFECRLYPFLMSREGEGVRLSAHLSCPFIQDKLNSREWTSYLAVLRAFFSDAAAREYLATEVDVLADYSDHQKELIDLFTLRTAFSEGLLAQRPLFDQYAGQSARPLSAFAFPSLFFWHGVYDFEFREMAGSLCVFARQPVGSFLYLPPLGGPDRRQAARLAFDYLRKFDHGSLGRIENVSRQDLALFDEREFEILPRSAEYIYDRADVAALAGQVYKSQRHDVNLLARSHDVRLRPFQESDAEVCANIFERWLDTKRSLLEDETQSSESGLRLAMIEENRRVHQLIMRYGSLLGVTGRVAVVDGEIGGYTFGYPVDKDTFCVVVEIADPAYKGLSAYLFSSLAADPELRSYQWLNAMDDFEIASLARAKKAWRPVRMEEAFAIRPR